MLRQGILNPQVLSLLARTRHTNTVVIADRGFPYWPELETIDLSLVDDVPTVRQYHSRIGIGCDELLHSTEHYGRDRRHSLSNGFCGRLD